MKLLGFFLLLVLALGLRYMNHSYTIDAALDNQTCTTRVSMKNMENNLCYTPVETIDILVPDTLRMLNNITSSSYFRFFKINSEKPCPYWAVSLLCSSSENACSVCKCDENAVPVVLRTSWDMSDFEIPSSLITQASPHPSNADSWGAWKHADTDDAEYVDLVQNPEGNTGYSGPLAANVWKAIYQENCFPLENKENCPAFKLPRILFSGMHTSILLHVATNFYRDPDFQSPHLAAGLYNNPNISYLPNCDMFLSRIAPSVSFLENVYVLYEFVTKALALSRDTFLGDLDLYNSGEGGSETEEDRRLKSTLHEFFYSPSLNTRAFDEKRFTETAMPHHVAAIQSMIRNVTSLMDCVTCEKCRIWGKLETKGIGTAMKIITSGKSIPLDRAERVALVNLARQVSFSVRTVQYMSKYCSGLKK